MDHPGPRGLHSDSVRGHRAGPPQPESRHGPNPKPPSDPKKRAPGRLRDARTPQGRGKTRGREEAEPGSPPSLRHCTAWTGIWAPCYRLGFPWTQGSAEEQSLFKNRPWSSKAVCLSPHRATQPDPLFPTHTDPQQTGKATPPTLPTFSGPFGTTQATATATYSGLSQIWLQES